jgi:predicted CopG family antitoxin
MEDTKTITISPMIYAELNAFMGILSDRLKRRVSIDDALENLLPRAHRNKPSDFAGAWVMSDEEEEEIKKSLKELWGTWELD